MDEQTQNTIQEAVNVTAPIVEEAIKTEIPVAIKGQLNKAEIKSFFIHTGISLVSVLIPLVISYITQKFNAPEYALTVGMISTVLTFFKKLLDGQKQ